MMVTVLMYHQGMKVVKVMKMKMWNQHHRQALHRMKVIKVLHWTQIQRRQPAMRWTVAQWLTTSHLLKQCESLKRAWL